MNIITDISEMQKVADSFRLQGRRIGFVPTMGFLHEGHLSLIRHARQMFDIVVVSIFVNPIQFGPSEDFDRYPRDEDGDLAKCKAGGVDIVFLPDAKEMYSTQDAVTVSVERISDIMEGAIRPGHYRGVATVVAKLFHIVKPHAAFFGQKDYQQCIIIKRLVKGLNIDVDIVIRPTVREADGLAMSSRNAYLNEKERRAATVIFRALSSAEHLIKSGVKDMEHVRSRIQATLQEEKGLNIDYIQIVDPDTLMPLQSMVNNLVILVAVRLGNTRLIDNVHIWP